MAGQKFQTKEGAELFVSYAPFEDGVTLVKAVSKVMMTLRAAGAAGDQGSVTLALFADPDVYACYLRCAKAATYKGRHIEPALFDDATGAGESASRDLLEIFDTVVTYNHNRFFPRASSASKATSPAA